MQKAQYSVVFKEKIKEFNKSIGVDSDKSLSIRSILFGAIVEGVSEVKNLLESDDVISAINFIKKLGVKLKKIKKGKYLIYGQGLGGLYAQKNITLDFKISICRIHIYLYL